MTKELIVFTDIEADDILALIFLKNLEKQQIVSIKSICVVSFDKKWNPVEKANKWFPQIDLNNVPRFDYVYENTDIQTNFQNWLIPQLETKPIIVSLASMSMLYRMDHKLFSECQLLCYGSANFRWSYDNNNAEDKSNFAQFINTSFKHVTLFETYFMFPKKDNTINNTTMPKFCEHALKSNSTNCSVIVDAVTEWNNHILFSMIERNVGNCTQEELNIEKIRSKQLSSETINKLKNSSDRRCKVILSIYEHTFQLVAADMMVALSYYYIFATKTGRITFNDRFMTVFTNDDDGKVNMVQEISMTDIDELIVGYIDV